MKLYLAGPMSGLPNKNYPAFFAAADQLRGVGHEVVNPAETELSQFGPDEPATWRKALCFDLLCVAEADGFAVLEGFEKSKGACLEVHTALALGKVHVLIPYQNEFWVKRVSEFFRVSHASMWRDVDYSRYVT